MTDEAIFEFVRAATALMPEGYGFLCSQEGEGEPKLMWHDSPEPFPPGVVLYIGKALPTGAVLTGQLHIGEMPDWGELLRRAVEIAEVLLAQERRLTAHWN